MTIARVQGGSNNGDAGGLTIAATISAVGSGNTICGFAAWDSAGGTRHLSTVTDDQSNTYNLETELVDTTSDQNVRAFSLSNITDAPTTITATFTDVGTTFRKIVVDEFSGCSTASTDERDSTAHGGQFQSSPGTGTDALTSGTFTTTQNGDLIYGTCMAPSTTTAATVGTNFTTGTTNNTTYVGQSEFREQATAGSGTAATFTQAVNTHRVTAMIAIKAGVVLQPRSGFSVISGGGVLNLLPIAY